MSTTAPQRFLLALTGVNLALLVAILSGQARPAAADAGPAPVLRGRALEIVDQRGQVRASIAIMPADASVRMPDGTIGYPETVLLRLRNAEGRPNVKLAATDDGAGMVLGGEVDPTFVQLLARSSKVSLKLSDGEGRVQLVEPR